MSAGGGREWLAVDGEGHGKRDGHTRLRDCVVNQSWSRPRSMPGAVPQHGVERPQAGGLAVGRFVESAQAGEALSLAAEGEGCFRAADIQRHDVVGEVVVGWESERTTDG